MRSATYDRFVNYLARIGEAFGIRTTVGLVYTDMMRSEAIILDGESYIAHDQYFGQVVNMMNRLFLYDASKRTKLIYFHKIASQMLSRYCFYEESIFAANRYREWRQDMDHAAKQRQDGSLRHGMFTAVQELFVLLHEQAHIIFKQHPDLLAELCVDVKAWLGKYRRQEGGLDKLDEAAVTHGLTEDELAYIREHETEFRESRQISQRLCEEIASRPELLEEFCCDQIALIHVLGYFAAGGYRVSGERQSREFSAHDKVTAILLCFLNMRTLQTLETMCALEENADFLSRTDTMQYTEGIYMTFYNARLHRAKELCYDLALNDEGDVESLHVNVCTLMDRHTDEIYATAASTMHHLLYDEQLRPEMARVFEQLKPEHAQDQQFKRRVTAMLHLIPDFQDESRVSPSGVPGSENALGGRGAEKRKRLDRLRAASRRKNKRGK